MPGKFQVFLDDLENPLITASVNVAEVMNLDQGRAWVGFTAATGADYYNQDVLSWSFDSAGSAAKQRVGSMITTSSHPEAMLPLQSAEPVYAGNAASSPVVSLPVDLAFGYGLPGDVGLTHQIETSTDLVHWTPLTNALFYFRDPESTNHDQRFYRFLGK